MFEAQTYEKLMADVLAQAPEDLDTRQGSIFFDAVSATVNKIARLYADLDRVFETVFITTATGQYLDMRAGEFGLIRQAATAAKYRLEYTGTRPIAGWRFFHNDSGYYFTLGEAEDGTLYLEAETAGTECNNIESGDIAVPVNTVQGMTSAVFGSVYEYGTDAEKDDDLRERVLEKVSGPAENGNKQHYKTWCESITGVGRARIQPLWNGENTVRAILISPLGLPVAQSVVDAVQEYVDPDDLGMTVEIYGKTYRVGDGLGNGQANIGAHFTATAAEALTVDVSFTAEPARGSTREEIKSVTKEAIDDYLKALVLESEDGATITVRISAVGAILAGLTSVLTDYSNLTLNGQTGNIHAGETEVPVTGEVTANVAS